MTLSGEQQVQSSSTAHFRKAPWGATKQQVKDGETAVLLNEEDDTLLYSCEFAGFTCAVQYTFRDGRLSNGVYYFNEEDDELDGVVHNKLRSMLEQKYGPGDEHITWKNPLRRVDIETVGQIGAAAAAGLLKIMILWHTADTRISLVIDGKEDSYDAHVLLFYTDKLREAEEDSSATDLDLL